MAYSIKSKKQEYQIMLGKKISDAGATSVIYSVKGNDSVVYKEYKKEYLTSSNKGMVFSKLEHFIKNHPSKDLQSEEIIGSTIHQLAWPKTMVYKNGKPSGFIMDKIDFDNSIQLNMLFNIKNRAKHSITEDITWRLYVAENLARVYSELHKSNYFVIDTKPANIRAYKSVPGVALLDCDGFKLEGSLFDGQHLTTDYIAPESIGISPEKLGREQDIFALSVLFFQIFNNGIHPFSGKSITKEELDIQEKIKRGSFPYGKKTDRLQEPSPFSLHHLFPEKLNQQFHEIFFEQKRPEADEWVGIFSDLKKNRSLSRCTLGKHGKSFKKGCTTCAHQKFVSTGKTSIKNEQQESFESKNPSEALQSFKYVPAKPPPKKSGNGAYLILTAVAIAAVVFGFQTVNTIENNTPNSSYESASKVNSSYTNGPINFPSFYNMNFNFKDCVAFANFHDSGFIGFGLIKDADNGKNNFYLVLKKTSKLVEPLKANTLEINFDNKDYFRHPFKHYEADGKIMFYSDFTYILPNLAKANSMKLKTKNKILNFPLGGSSIVSQKLINCKIN